MMSEPIEARLPDKTSEHARIAAAIDAVGHPGFSQAISGLCEAASGYTSTFISAFFHDHPPTELFDNLSDHLADTSIAPYLDFAYLLDPFHDVFRNGVSDQVMTLGECAPDNFRASTYFRRFYADTGLFDETTVFVSFGTDACIVISLGSREADFRLSADGLTSLKSLLPIISALCRRHWPRLHPSSITDQGRLGSHLEKSFDRFGTSVLSNREGEIARLVLKGHSSKSVARLLGNSPETVKVHRKRIYAKLDIASQGELFSVFLDALLHTPSNATEDPLYYLNRSADVRRPCISY